MKKITIKELAQILNMSVSTISRALSDHPDISVPTKLKVQEASKLYNYSPNLRARYLRTKSSGLIALVLPEFHMFFIPELMKNISNIVSENNYSLLVFQSEDSYLKELDIIDYCNQISVDGILLSIGNGFDHKKDLIELNRDGAPIVLVDKIWENEEINSVGIEGSVLGKKAVMYLYSCGHKNIGGIFARSSQMISENRMEGFLEGISNLKNEINGKTLIINDVLDFENPFEDFIKQNPEITAIFTMTDEIMLRCHSKLLKMGKSIPEDISIISISDGVLPKFLTPSISHYYHSPADIGKEAAKVLINLIKDKNNNPKSIRLECALVELDSVKKLNSVPTHFKVQ